MEYAPLLERLAQMDTFNAEKSAEIKRLDELYRKEKKIADEASFLYKQLKDEAAADAGGGAAQLRAAHAQFEVDKYSFRASFDEVANQVLADHRAEVERLCAVIAAADAALGRISKKVRSRRPPSGVSMACRYTCPKL